jgi:diguanylate cyclase (GGDEF)-like protein
MDIDRDRIDQWMTEKPVFMDAADSLGMTIRMMREHRIGAMLVVEKQKLVGVFTERDILSLVEKLSDGDLLQQPIAGFMTQKPITVNSDESFSAVYMKMKVNNIRHLPVLKGSDIVGIISLRDLAEFYEKRMEGDLENSRSQVEHLRRFFDLTENREGEKILAELERLEELSLTDFLTGLYNTRYLNARLTEELERAKRHQTHLSVIFCDIDFFKQVNDRCGHQFGDYVLKEIGQLLVSKVDDIKIIARLRKSDVVARYGGEEFVVILPETSKKDAVEVAERMRQAIANHHFQGHGKSASVTMSFGVAEYPEDSLDCDSLVQCADLAMYQAKMSGRNRVVAFASDSTSSVGDARLQLVVAG